MALLIGGAIFMLMNILEKDIQEVIYKTWKRDPLLLVGRGLPVSTHANFIELEFDIGGYGRIDIIGIVFYDSVDPYVQIIETKKVKLRADHLQQLIRYITGVRQILQMAGYRNPCVEGMLIGPDIDSKSDWVYAMDEIYSVQALTYAVDIELGITFESHRGYRLVDPRIEKQIEMFTGLKQSIEASSTTKRLGNG